MMQTVPVLTAVIVVFLIKHVDCTNRLGRVSTSDEYMNLCLDGIYHKETPGKERFLFNECSRYQDRACCHGNTTIKMFGGSRWHGMAYDHCPGHTMGSECRRMFLAELCFYECSPNVGPWLVQVDQKIRKERPYDVPLCKQQCDSWWQKCKMEYTCVTNWGRSFEWKNGHNQCPDGTTCDTYDKQYGSAKNFCEKVWDGGWKVVDDEKACFRFDFDPSGGNPNYAVALQKSKEILGSDASRSVVSSLLFIAVSLMWNIMS